MAGDEGQPGTEIAVRQRHPGVIWHCYKGGNARHDLKFNARIRQLLSFLGAAAKHVGVTALEPHNGLALLRFVDEQPIELTLRNRL